MYKELISHSLAAARATRAVRPVRALMTHSHQWLPCHPPVTHELEDIDSFKYQLILIKDTSFTRVELTPQCLTHWTITIKEPLLPFLFVKNIVKHIEYILSNPVGSNFGVLG